MIFCASAALDENRQQLNELNVFPVPDGDTGTNMSLTMASATREVNQKEYLNAGEAAAELAPLYLEIALDDAFYYLEYAVGYSLLQQEQRDAKAELGEAFDLRAFHEAFLSIGPTYFNLIAPRLDAWVAAQR